MTMPSGPDGNLTIEAKLIKGLLPAIDPRAVDKPFIINGANFLLDAKGPYAAFSSSIPINVPLTDFKNVDTFQITISGVIQDVLLTTGNAYTFDSVQNRFFLAFQFADSGKNAPWTVGVCGGKNYFVKDGVNGIVQYDPIQNQWQLIAGGVNNIPANPIYCSQSQGLLGVLTATTFFWSALDDGTNFAPVIGSAGAQGLSITGGTGIAVKEVYDGFVTYTTKGIMKSEVTGGVNIFRHYVISRSYQPIDYFNIFDLENKHHVILDTKGFYINNIGYAQVMEPMASWQPEFSEYLFNTLFDSLDLTVVGQLRCFYDAATKLLFLQVASRYDIQIAQLAFSLYANRNEWGCFNWPSTRFCNLTFLQGTKKGRNLGYFDAAGQWNMFIPGQIGHEMAPAKNADFNYHSWGEAPIHSIMGGVTSFVSEFHLTDIREDLLFPTISGNYNITVPASFGTTITPPKLSVYNVNVVDINSYILVGLFRIPPQKYSDEITTVIDVAISSDSNQDIYVDYMDPKQFPGNTFLDYMTSNSPDEDWGSIPAAICPVSIIGTADGSAVFNSEVLTLRINSGNTQYYTCNNNGVWHALNFSTAGPGQTYHLKLLEISMIDGGRL